MKKILLLVALGFVVFISGNAFAAEGKQFSVEAEETLMQTVDENLSYVDRLLDEKKGYAALNELDQIEERFAALDIKISGPVILFLRATGHLRAIGEDLQKVAELKKQIYKLLESAEHHDKEAERYLKEAGAYE